MAYLLPRPLPLSSPLRSEQVITFLWVWRKSCRCLQMYMCLYFPSHCDGFLFFTLLLLLFFKPCNNKSMERVYFVCLFFKTPSCLISPVCLPGGIFMSTDVHGPDLGLVGTGMNRTSQPCSNTASRVVFSIMK